MLFQEADIINLHWVGNFVDYPSFFKICKKPVVWTLHDYNPCMGCFHYPIDLKRENNLKEINKGLAEKKAKILSNFSNLHVVALSRALMNYSKKSSQLQKFPHYHIFNSVDIRMFKPLSVLNAKQILELPTDKKIVLVFSYPLSVCYKGMDLFFELFQKHFFSDIHFIFIGPLNDKTKTQNSFTVYPYIRDELLLSIFYSASDMLLITSREENLPNVMLEAMSCGTSVISFPVGGMLDVIKTGFNGILADESKVEAMVGVLMDFNNGKYTFSRDDIRNYAVQNFSPSVQAGKYIELYKKILAC